MNIQFIEMIGTKEEEEDFVAVLSNIISVECVEFVTKCEWKWIK